MGTQSERQEFEGWVILEIMGHRRLGGYLRSEQIAGAAFIRIDVPGTEEGVTATQFYAPGSVYCITPTTEDLARAFAEEHQPQPVTRWDLPALPQPRPAGVTAEYREADEEEWP